MRSRRRIGRLLHFIFDKLKIDDPVGAIPVHGDTGIWGLLYYRRLWPGIFFASLVVWFVLKKIMGIRVSEEQE